MYVCMRECVCMCVCARDTLSLNLLVLIFAETEGLFQQPLNYRSHKGCNIAPLQ